LVIGECLIAEVGSEFSPFANPAQKWYEFAEFHIILTERS